MSDEWIVFYSEYGHVRMGNRVFDPDRQELGQEFPELEDEDIQQYLILASIYDRDRWDY